MINGQKEKFIALGVDFWLGKLVTKGEISW